MAAAKASALASLVVLMLLLRSQDGNALRSGPSFEKIPLLARLCHFDKIYNFGDSISDTGNLIRESPVGAMSRCARLPYGETFFKHATGRCSDGLLMIDFIALAFGLPLLNAYKETNANFLHGVNFAVAGSTAIPSDVLAASNIVNPSTNSSLDVQLDWMHSYFSRTCNTNPLGCVPMNAHSLFIVGEIGGNDYNYALLQRKSLAGLEKMVPDVVETISTAVRKVIQYGARWIVVPGNFPIGCLPIYLTAFQTNDPTAYDDLGCLKGLNNFATYHNEVLQQAIQNLRAMYRYTTIVYADYYTAFLWVLRNSNVLGFNVKSIHKACCGIGGDYNFNMKRICGSPGVPVCSDPATHMSWDGLHMTQKAYKLMASWIMNSNILPEMGY